MQTETTLAGFVHGLRFEDLTPAARGMVRKLLLATSGTGVAGAGEEGVAELHAMLDERGGSPQATTLVFGTRLPAASAAQLNGTMCRALDFCDAMAPGVHIGSSLVPAAFAAAELRGGCDGREFVTALAAGAELSSRLNLTESMYDGFDPTGIAAVFGAAAAAARILGLDAEGIRHALALAFNRCGGSFQSNVDGSLAVRLIQGWVAEGGVSCAQMAARGMTGPGTFVEGIYGYRHLYGRDRLDVQALVAGLGSAWRLERMMFKKYPSCGVTQGATDLALELVREIGLSPATLASAEVRLPPYCHRLVGTPFEIGANPRVNAQFSAQYCVANAVLRGASRLEHFREAEIRDPAIAALIPRIAVLADAGMDARGHSSVDLEVVTTDGVRHTRRYDVSPGYPDNPLIDAELQGRFDDCMSYAAWPLAPEQRSGWLQALAAIEAQADVTRLLPLLVSAAGQREAVRAA
ncbi:MAG: MmgE/PrpD family protein [Burkholderiales bacterium]|nr:MAG: MmgE/PrpD family protein [Burkholderiales bacterium]